MKRKHIQRHGKLVGIGALAIAASLVGSLAIGTNAAAQSSEWDGNGAPTFLKTAPAGTPIDAPAKKQHLFLHRDNKRPNGFADLHWPGL